MTTVPAAIARTWPSHLSLPLERGLKSATVQGIELEGIEGAYPDGTAGVQIEGVEFSYFNRENTPTDFNIDVETFRSDDWATVEERVADPAGVPPVRANPF